MSPITALLPARASVASEPRLVIRSVGNLLFGGGGFDLPIVGGAFLTLAAAALAANWIPARRATRVAPSVAFRN